MHELTIIENILQIAAQTADEGNLSHIRKINVVIGKMHQVVPDILRSGFMIASEGTKSENAVLEIETVPVRIKCKLCDAEYEVTDLFFLCRQCGSHDIKMTSGKELYVNFIEGE